MTKAVKIILAVLAVTLLLTIVFAFSIPFVNDAVANGVRRSLVELPPPEDTEIVESLYKAAKLVGNGNGMQYLGAILLRTELTYDEIRSYYTDAYDGEVFVEAQRTNEIDWVNGTLAFKSELTEGESYYIVYSFGTAPSIFREFDVRGH